MRNNSVNYFEFGPVVQEVKSFKDISHHELWHPFCSAELIHLCQLGRGHYEKQSCDFISNLGQWFRRKCHFKYFLSGTLAALLFGGAKPFMQFWKRASWGTFMRSFMKFGPVVQEEMSFKEKVYGRWKMDDQRRTHDACQTKTNHNTSPWAFRLGELKCDRGH